MDLRIEGKVECRHGETARTALLICIQSLLGESLERILSHDDSFLRAVNIESLHAFREAHMAVLIDHALLTSGIFLIDGTGLRGSDRHVVIMQQGGSAPPLIVNWRVRGPGKELEAGRAMVEELQQEVGAEAIHWLLMNGPWLQPSPWPAPQKDSSAGAVVGM